MHGRRPGAQMPFPIRVSSLGSIQAWIPPFAGCVTFRKLPSLSILVRSCNSTQLRGGGGSSYSSQSTGRLSSLRESLIGFAPNPLLPSRCLFCRFTRCLPGARTSPCSQELIHHL